MAAGCMPAAAHRTLHSLPPGAPAAPHPHDWHAGADCQRGDGAVWPGHDCGALGRIFCWGDSCRVQPWLDLCHVKHRAVAARLRAPEPLRPRLTRCRCPAAARSSSSWRRARCAPPFRALILTASPAPTCASPSPPSPVRASIDRLFWRQAGLVAATAARRGGSHVLRQHAFARACAPLHLLQAARPAPPSCAGESICGWQVLQVCNDATSMVRAGAALCCASSRPAGGSDCSPHAACPVLRPTRPALPPCSSPQTVILMVLGAVLLLWAHLIWLIVLVFSM